MEMQIRVTAFSYLPSVHFSRRRAREFIFPHGRFARLPQPADVGVVPPPRKAQTVFPARAWRGNVCAFSSNRNVILEGEEGKKFVLSFLMAVNLLFEP